MIMQELMCQQHRKSKMISNLRQQLLVVVKNWLQEFSMLSDFVCLWNFSVNSENHVKCRHFWIPLRTFFTWSTEILLLWNKKVFWKLLFSMFTVESRVPVHIQRILALFIYSVLMKLWSRCFIVCGAAAAFCQVIVQQNTARVKDSIHFNIVNLISAFLQLKPLLKNLGRVKAYLQNPNDLLATIKRTKAGINLSLTQLEWKNLNDDGKYLTTYNHIYIFISLLIV